MPVPSPATTSVSQVAEVIQLALAPVFLLAGIGAFLNVCASRLARIVDRARGLEQPILRSVGAEHDRLIDELRLLDRRIRVVNLAIFFTVLSALLVSAVVVVLFASFLAKVHNGVLVALLFMASMLATGAGFGVFLYETQLATRAVRIRAQLLDHRPADPPR